MTKNALILLTIYLYLSLYWYYCLFLSLLCVCADFMIINLTGKYLKLQSPIVSKL